MNSGFIGGLTQTRNGVPFFGLMALVGLLGYLYYNYMYKNGRDDKGFHGIMKKYVIPVTLIVVLGTLLLSNFNLTPTVPTAATQPTQVAPVLPYTSTGTSGTGGTSTASGTL